MASCPACGTPTGAAKFCPECGAPQPTGPAAATPRPRAAPAGGGSVPDEASAPKPQSSVAQRRICSVLFADLVGFTPMSESRDPEEVRELLSRYFESARTVIGRYGGVVEKFIGDAVMAVWGTPVASEGDAERAVRAALDVVDAVAALGAELGAPELAARAGVVTGEVAVTLGATGEGMVAGDAVNTAARVQASAAPGTVLVDGATRRLSAAAIGFDDAGDHSLKGKAEPERLWRATRVLAMVGGGQRIDGLEAPLTGRDAELRTIKELFHAAAERRTPRLVVVSGAAGVGKSRLGWEFYKYLDGLAVQVLWHRGRCLSYGEGVAFWALAEAIRSRLGIAEEDPTGVAAGKLAERLPEFVPDPTERQYVAVRLGRLLGVPVEGDSGEPLGREELFAGWRLFFERLAAANPVVLTIEDAQHADSSLLDFCDHLVDWARGLPIYVLVFARPELEEIRPGFGVGRNRSRLTLDPLDAGSMRALLDALVPGMPDAAASAIIDHAQGVPLFAVETVRSLIDRDVVVPVEGSYRLVGDLGPLAVPDSLHGLLAGRLDALPDGIRALVADAAVLGTSFPAEALVAVSGRPDAEVQAALAELVRREVLEVSADRLSPQRGAYRFAQQMLRQVAYDTLSRRDRKTRHLAVAAHLRATFPGDAEEIADVVAQHYLDAAAVVPDDPDAPAQRDQARSFLVRSADRALRAGAPGPAAASYARAAQLAADSGAVGAAAAECWEAAAGAAIRAADYRGAIGYAERAEEGYRQDGQPRAAARAATLAGRALRRAGRQTESRGRLLAALEVLRAEPDTDTVAALEELATVEVFAGSKDADRLSAEAIALGQALDVAPGQLAQLFTVRGVSQMTSNRPAEAAAYHREAARLAELAGDAAALGRSLNNLSSELGSVDPKASIEAARMAAGHVRRIGDHQQLGIVLGNQADVLLEIGEWAEAEAVLADAASDGLDDPFLRTVGGYLAALRGDVDAAQAAYTFVVELGHEDSQDHAEQAALAALIGEARGDSAAALQHARAALEQIPALGLRSGEIDWSWPVASRAAHALGDAAAAAELLALLDAHPVGHLTPVLRAERDLTRARLAGCGHDGAPDRRFETAIAELRRFPAPHHLGHALLDYAEQLSVAGEHAAATSAVGEARQIAERLRAKPLLVRADTAAAAVSA
jgi:class 3 adenylate cyclase/tetratricopeptide (TPR) repeat protein